MTYFTQNLPELNGKRMSKISKWPSLSSPSLTNDFYDRFVSMEKAQEQGLALQQHFPYKSSNFSENSNCLINLLFNAWGLKLRHLCILDALFLFLAFSYST